MEKESILEEKLGLIEWCQTFKCVTHDVWFESFRKGSWGIADVISHFIVWDVFLIKHRIPYFISGQSVPNVPIDVEEMNKGAMKHYDFRQIQDIHAFPNCPHQNPLY